MLALAAGAVVGALLPRPAHASVARAFDLGALVGSSEHVVEATALEGFCRWERLGKRRRIVTYTRVRVERSIKGASAGDELLIRTLGGRVDDVGQVVHGEALLLVGERAMLFLAVDSTGSLAVRGLAQGHYPVRADARGVQRLAPSPRLPELHPEDRRGAVARLVGLTPEAARQVVIEAGAR